MASSTHRIRIHADRDTVFQALSTTVGLKGWYTAQIDGIVAEGNTATFHFPKDETFTWKFTNLKPDAGIIWECQDGPGAAKDTKAVFGLKEDGQDTVVTCEHQGWPEGHEALATCNTLWGILMGHLREYAEERRPMPAYR